MLYRVMVEDGLFSYKEHQVWQDRPKKHFRGWMIYIGAQRGFQNRGVMMIPPG